MSTYFVSTTFLSGSPLKSSTRSLSPSSVVPLAIKDAVDSNITFDQNKIQYTDGYSLYRAGCLVNAKDIKRNNTSLMWLTTAQTYDEMLVELSVLNDVSDYLTQFGFVYSYIRVSPASTTGSSKYFFSRSGTELVLTADADIAEIFKISLTDSGKYNIQSGDWFLTTDINTYLCSFQLYDQFNTSYIQEYNIALADNILHLYVQDNSTAQTIYRYIGSDINLVVKAAGVGSGAYPSRYDTVSVSASASTNKHVEYDLELYYENLDTFQFGNINSKNTAWVKYYNELADKARTKTVDINTDDSIDNIPVNHLIVSPLEAQVSPSTETIFVNYLPLKNVMTPEQQYAITPFAEDNGTISETRDISLRPKRREYQKIFPGNNDVDGYDKPLLTFTSNTKLCIIPADGETYFHYPHEAIQLPLSASGLIEAGAIAGNTPYDSDRIYKKNANYKKFTHWGDSQQIFGCADGIWLCAWLSGSGGSSLEDIEQSVWIDRWYNPSKTTIGSVLSLGYNDISVSSNSPVFFDVPSEMTFDPGMYYRYDRVSNDRLDDIIDTFTSVTSSLRLHYKDEWGQEVTDISGFNNHGSIENFTSERIINIGPAYGGLSQTAITLNTNTYIDIPYSTSISLTGSFTLATWVHSSNWINNPGSSIIATGFRGGMSIDYTNHFFNPIVSVIEDTYGHVLQYSQCAALADTRLST